MRFRIDLKIFIFLILFYFTKKIQIYATIMIFALIHELGHLAVGLIMGMKPEKIELMPFGFSVSFKINVKEYNKKLNIITSFLIIYTNFLIMIFNLLPIYPLDGGRILKGILSINFGKRKAEKYINCISKVTIIVIITLSSILILYVHNIAIFLINIYLLYLVIKEDIKFKKREDIYSKILENEII